MVKVAINGFGRIGRSAFRRILARHPDLEVAAINDLGEPQTLAHLLKYDSIYGIYERPVKVKDGEFLINGKDDGRKVKILAERDPEKLPWKKLGIDVVLECTGIFTTKEGAEKHLRAGAGKVLISANCKSAGVPTYVMGVNQENYDPKKDNIMAMASCTTNCLAPIAKVLHDEFGIEKGFMTTVHSYTNNQKLLDASHKDLRRARAAALNIIPTTTGASRAVEKCLPDLKGRLSGLALRVPTPTVSIVDFTAVLGKKVSAEEINYSLKKASEREELRGILGVEDKPLVSSDYRGNSFSSVVDALSTRALGNMAKVLAWYDNEYGYACRLAEMTEFIGKKL